MIESSEVEALDDQIEALETTLGGASSMAAAFDGELRKIEGSLVTAGAGAAQLSGSISRGLRRAFEGLVFDGMKLSDALKTVANSIIDATYAAAIKPVTSHLGSLIGQGVEGLITSAFAKGGTFTQGRVQPFAKGGVVSQATMFPMRGGARGLMGEAGPEAIMPLARGADGSLGVRAQSSGPVQVTMNITTPDVAGFQRSQGQIAAQMGRALARGQRNR